jgi:aspartate aminotransferase-like enzyme
VSFFCGVGGLYVPGRWHFQGHKIVYTAENLSLASLEVFVHLESERVKLVAIKASIDKELEIEEIEIIEVSTPSITAAFLQIYRQGRAKDSPVHALGAYIVVDGVNCAKIEPVHTQGWNKRQLDSYVRKCLSSLSSKFGITSFAEKEVMDISVQSCPICADQKQLQRKI